MRNESGRGCGKRRASARSVALSVVAPLIAVVALICVARPAYAEVNWEEKDETSGNGRMHAQVAPWDWPDGRMNALAEFLGYDWDSFSDEVKENILADDDVITLRDKTKNLAREYFQFEDPNIIEAFLNAASRAVLAVWNTLFGSFKIWDIDCTYAEYKRAQMVFLKYSLANNGGSGGGSGGESGGQGTIIDTLIANNKSNSNSAPVFEYTENDRGSQLSYKITAKEVEDTDQLKYVQQMKVIVNDYFREQMETYMASFENPEMMLRAYGYSSYTNPQLNIIIGEDLEYNETNASFTCKNGYYALTGYSGTRYFGYDGTDYLLVLQPTSMTINRYSQSGGTFSDSSYNAWISMGADQGGGEGGGGDYTPTPKPDPTRPDGPEIHLPDIDIDPTVYDWPDPSIHIDVDLPDLTVQPDFGVTDQSWDVALNINLDPTISVTGSGTDVVPWLERILAAINALRSENRQDFNQTRTYLEVAFNMIRNGLEDMDEDLVQGMGFIYDYMGTFNGNVHADLEAMNRQIQEEGKYLAGKFDVSINQRIQWLAENINRTLYDFDKDILEELNTQAKYIVENLEFDADNSKLETWLKKIYAKLNRNPSGIPDVTTDTGGWAEAIEELIRKLLEGLVGAANVAELAQMLNELQDRFPISIPWDLMAIVTLFSGEAVTPQFDFPIYFGSQHITDISIDLTPYEEVGEVSRTMSLLLFACMLLMETKTLLNATTTVTRKAG